MRGSALVPRQLVRALTVSPAHAGIGPRAAAYLWRAPGLPRACGDRPSRKREDRGPPRSPPAHAGIGRYRQSSVGHSFCDPHDVRTFAAAVRRFAADCRDLERLNLAPPSHLYRPTPSAPKPVATPDPSPSCHDPSLQGRRHPLVAPSRPCWRHPIRPNPHQSIRVPAPVPASTLVLLNYLDQPPRRYRKQEQVGPARASGRVSRTPGHEADIDMGEPPHSGEQDLDATSTDRSGRALRTAESGQPLRPNHRVRCMDRHDAASCVASEWHKVCQDLCPKGAFRRVRCDHSFAPAAESAPLRPPRSARANGYSCAQKDHVIVGEVGVHLGGLQHEAAVVPHLVPQGAEIRGHVEPTEGATAPPRRRSRPGPARSGHRTARARSARVTSPFRGRVLRARARHGSGAAGAVPPGSDQKLARYCSSSHWCTCRS